MKKIDLRTYQANDATHARLYQESRLPFDTRWRMEAAQDHGVVWTTLSDACDVAAELNCSLWRQPQEVR